VGAQIDGRGDPTPGVRPASRVAFVARRPPTPRPVVVTLESLAAVIDVATAEKWQPRSVDLEE